MVFRHFSARLSVPLCPGATISVRAMAYTIAIASLTTVMAMYYASSIHVMDSTSFESWSEERAVQLQKRRHQTLRMACEATRAMRPEESPEFLIKHRELLNHVIVNDEHKLLYCTIPKAASTQWKMVMGVLGGSIPNISFSNMPKNILHQRSRHLFLNVLPPSEIRHRLATYTSFLFVRHPLHRLVSGYRNKFRNCNRNCYFPRLFGAKIIAKYRRGGGGGGHKNVTFAEFARWVSDPRAPPSPGTHNEHWKPMARLCWPCAINYTVIGQLETMPADARLVLRMANTTSALFPTGFHSQTPSVTSEMLATLTPDEFRNVLRLYYEDLLLFGYHPSSVFTTNTTAMINSELLLHSVFAQSSAMDRKN